jgi:signal transduction histidine kinase/HAMP domain-containing protein/ActR/RegA family two-component response regulator
MKPYDLSINPGLRAKLFIAFLLVALVPLGTLALLNEQTMRRTLTEETYHALHVAASQIAFGLDALVEANLNAIRTEAQSPALVSYLALPAAQRPDHEAVASKAMETLKTFGNKDPVSISSYALLDHRGINVIDTVETHIGWDESSSDYFQQAVRTGQPYIAHIRISPEMVGTLGIYYSCAIRDETGEIIGVLRARYFAASVQRVIAENTGLAGKASYVILLDEHLIHLAHGTDPTLILQPIVPLDPYEAAALRNAGRLPQGSPTEPTLRLYELKENLRNADATPYFSTSLGSPDGEVYAAAVAKMETVPWTVIVVQPEEAFLAPIQARTQTPLIVAAVIALVVTGAAFAGGHYLAAPIVQLTSVAQAVEQGDLGTRAEVRTQDEIGQLATAFNSMTGQLVGTLDALQQYVERLRALRAIDGAVLGARSLEDIARAALNHLQAILPEMEAGILTFDENVAAATVVAFTSEDSGPMPGMYVPIQHQDIIEALQQGKVLRKQDIAALVHPSPGMAALQAAGVRTFVIIPLIANGHLIGALAVGARDADAIAPEHIDIAREIADEVAVGLHQVRLRAALNAEQRRLQALVVHLPEGILLLDSAQRILLTNPAAEKALPRLTDAGEGDKLERLGDRPLSELLTSPPKGLWHEVNADSQVFEVVARPINHDHQPESWVLVINDVTQQRQVEGRIQQQERLASVGQLAAGIAHDFNNILTGIVMYAQMMARTPELSPHNRERLSIIDQQARHAAKLIQQILDFSRRAVIERKPLSLAPFLKEQSRLLERTLPENIKIELDYGGDEIADYIVEGDPTRLQQAFMNLAFNARDAMPEGGTLRIELQQIQTTRRAAPLPEMAAGEWVYIAFSDTGMGIPPDVLPHIFEPFFTTKEPRAGGGVGLGLAQVHGIIGQHGGFIDVESEADQGTTFSIYLPALHTEEIQPPDAEAPALIQGHGETILVVEDNAPARQALVETLQVLNYTVLAATNGREALEVYQAALDAENGSGVDLVLTDVVMPEMGGISLAQHLKKLNPEIKMLAITGHMLTQDLQDLRNMGVVDIIHKPVDMDTLAETIRWVLDAE